MYNLLWNRIYERFSIIHVNNIHKYVKFFLSTYDCIYNFLELIESIIVL